MTRPSYTEAAIYLRNKLMDSYAVDTQTGCWNWRLGTTDKGYGQLGCSSNGKCYSYLAHRLMYEATREPIPTELVIDHLCRNHRCVNPEHLEVVTVKENNLRGYAPPAIEARKTHCKHGHLFPRPSNGIYRRCSECEQIRWAARVKAGIYEKKRQQYAANKEREQLRCREYRARRKARLSAAQT